MNKYWNQARLLCTKAARARTLISCTTIAATSPLPLLPRWPLWYCLHLLFPDFCVSVCLVCGPARSYHWGWSPNEIHGLSCAVEGQGSLLYTRAGPQLSWVSKKVEDRVPSLLFLHIGSRSPCLFIQSSSLLPRELSSLSQFCWNALVSVGVCLCVRGVVMGL